MLPLLLLASLCSMRCTSWVSPMCCEQTSHRHLCYLLTYSWCRKAPFHYRETLHLGAACLHVISTCDCFLSMCRTDHCAMVQVVHFMSCPGIVSGTAPFPFLECKAASYQGGIELPVHV